MDKSERHGSILGSVAYAQEPTRGWSVPSLAAWREKAPTLRDGGYTEFSVSTAAFVGKPVYAVEVSLAVDGQPVLEDGLLPEQRPEPYSGRSPFTYGFGLRSLDMQGRYAGCDRLDLTLTPLVIKGPRLPPLKVSRNIVALRPLVEATTPSQGGEGAVTLSGVYKPPKEKKYEREIFLIAIPFGAAYEPGAMRKALAQVDDKKKRFDSLGLVYNGRPLVGVVRPPLNTSVYGLAIGAYTNASAPDQLSFTFDKSTANALQSLVDANPRVFKIFRTKSSPYPAGSTPEKLQKGTPERGCLAV